MTDNMFARRSIARVRHPIPLPRRADCAEVIRECRTELDPRAVGGIKERNHAARMAGYLYVKHTEAL